MKQLRKTFLLCVLILASGFLTLLVDLPSPTEIKAQTVASPITRYQVLYKALRYSVYLFPVESYNVGTRTWEVCGGETTISSDPYYQAGHQYQGVAYKWGGGDTLDDLGSYWCCERFRTRLDNGDLVGDTDTGNMDHCSYGKPTCPDAAGVDCSGFVTRVWGRPANEKYGTSTLPDISTAIDFNQGDYQNDLPRKMRMGDIFNYAGNHVLLSYYFENDLIHTPHFYESNWDENRVVESVGWERIDPVRNDNTGYRPYRYDNIVDDVYLPDIRANPGDWNSTIIIRNNGYGNARVQVAFYNSSGNVENSVTDTSLAGQAVWILDASSVVNNFSGSAVVAADKDISVLAENLKSGEATNYNGITPSNGLGNAGWGQAGTTIYAPAVKFEKYGRSGRLYIFNPREDTANVTPSFRQWDASTSDPIITCSGISIPPYGRFTFYPSSCQDDLGKELLSTDTIYGAKLTSDQPLAVVVVEQDDAGDPLTASSNAFSTGTQDNDAYVPLVKSDYHGNSTGVVVQNVSPLGSGSTLVTAYYYDENGDYLESDSDSIAFHSAHNFWAPDKLASDTLASAWLSGGDKLVSTVYETKLLGAWRMQHNGLLNGTSTVILPRIYKNYGTPNWRTGIQVQNVGGNPANLTVRYYDQNGDPDTDADDHATSVQPLQSVTFYQPNNAELGDESTGETEFVGSAVITSDQPIVAVVNVARDGSGDAAMSYSGFNR